MEAGVAFTAVDMPDASPFVINIMASVAEHERELIAERTRAALAVAKARGVRLGANGAVLAAAHKAAATSFAQALVEPLARARAAGAVTLRQYADALNCEGLITREGAAWSPGTVGRVLQRLEYVRVQPLNALAAGRQVNQGEESRVAGGRGRTSASTRDLVSAAIARLDR